MILSFLFGCTHKLSRVFTIRRRTYQVCLDCGREFDYDWNRMGLREKERPLKELELDSLLMRRPNGGLE
jgi:hypothetical protein